MSDTFFTPFLSDVDKNEDPLRIGPVFLELVVLSRHKREQTRAGMGPQTKGDVESTVNGIWHFFSFFKILFYDLV